MTNRQTSFSVTRGYITRLQSPRLATRGSGILVFKWALLVVASLASACASGPQYSAIEPPIDGHAVIYIFRKPGVFGLAMRPDIVVDGKLAGDLPASSYLRIEVPASNAPRHVGVLGRNCIQLEGAGALAAVSGNVLYVELDIKVGSQAAGDRYVWQNTCRLQRVDSVLALEALKGLKRAN